jgi:CIC family chloride channel protein
MVASSRDAVEIVTTVPDPAQLGWRQWLRSLVRRSEFFLAVAAAVIGSATGAAVVGMSRIAREAHYLLYGVALDEGLSAATDLPPWSFFVPAAGGLVLGLVTYILRRRKARIAVDPVEANALHGGVMSVRDSIVVAAQTVLSNGAGASVGLEAGYTQIGGALGSRVGRALRLRRQDMRVLVGCGTAAAIASAFNAPIAGGFYAFELIVGSYAVATIAPVMTAAFAATLVTRALGGATIPLHIGDLPPVATGDYPLYLILGVLAGLIGIVIMRGVALAERLVGYSKLPQALRPVVGGAILGLMALVTPQVLSAGHGALHMELHAQTALSTLLIVFVLKALASAISLGCGFRGGLFFASLFLGALLGKFFAAILVATWPALAVASITSTFVGMTALAVAIVGGPMTMTFLALETTGDVGVGSAALVAAIASSIVVREFFGYSFSTWRLHLRGETIRSAHDVGWIRNLTVRTMMRPPTRTAPETMPLTDFRLAFPLGSGTRAVVLDEAGRYAGIVLIAQAHAVPVEGETEAEVVADIAKYRDLALVPSMNVKEAIAAFDTSESDALAVIDDAHSRKVVGVLTEAHALRRYSEELDQARRGVAGELI